MVGFDYTETLYTNALSSSDAVKNWHMEGQGAVSFPMGRMRLEGTLDAEEGQKANLVFWCPQSFPDDISIMWDFFPIREPGLCILFFAARGHHGKDLFSPDLAPRQGPYEQYHHGDIDALHISYFRRRYPSERAFTTCNLRKSYGFHMVASAPDPIPSVPDAQQPYQIEIIKNGPHVVFGIGHAASKHEIQPILEWVDDGNTKGPLLADGYIGFRQMVPLIAEYANLKVQSISKARKLGG